MRTITCDTCGGTGWQILNRSAFASDGYRRTRCGICAGSGESDFHHHDRPFVNEQARRRSTAVRQAVIALAFAA